MVFVSCFRKTRNNPSSSTAKVIGPVIAIGDFDDGYDMPPAIVKPVISDDENLKRAVSRKFITQ